MKEKDAGDSDRISLKVLEMHLGLCFSINNAYEHLSLLKFDLGSSIGTSSFDVFFFFKLSCADKTLNAWVC